MYNRDREAAKTNNKTNPKSKKLRVNVLNSGSPQQLIDEHLSNIIKYIEDRGLGRYTHDILQDALIKLAQKVEEEDVIDQRAYLFVIVTFKVKEYQNRIKRDRGLFCSLEEHKAQCENKALEDPNLLKEIEETNHEKQTKLLHHMEEHLPPHQRRILYLKFFENKPYKEISKIMNKSEVSVRKEASRARDKLRNLML